VKAAGINGESVMAESIGEAIGGSAGNGVIGSGENGNQRNVSLNIKQSKEA
jgi:hypothetical protein